ncbi:MAG: 6-hydroxymethylpterin diphosphokinase MptE-like protein [Euryarchaeota archaeon]|nr:MAG: 6-hydroxymethyl-7,8-dihydropterin pyrophosphokinase [ANME-2 cluster archaeon]MEA1865270.1 6-hydroxymethylpterin diphosphokinase MptE-like protein [Euryarchaeota archaeon]
MQFSEWEPLYLQILADFGFDRSEDERSARILSDLLNRDGTATLSNLREIVSGRDVAVCGNAPSLASDLQSIRQDQITIAADGATTVLLENGMIPDVIVTDLDGVIDDIVSASKKRSFVVVHAHGDNIPAVRSVVPMLKRTRVLGTTQSEPFGNIHNFGGFSDGDRCVFLADELHAASVSLFGFDYDDPHVSDVKRKKLIWAKRLIEEYR